VNKNRDMAFWDHVYEIRNRLLVVTGSVLVLSVASSLFYPLIVKEVGNIIKEEVYVFTYPGGFLTLVNISILLGLFFSIPILLSQIILFVLPALKAREKVYMFLALGSSYLLFLSGVFFAYKSVLPASIIFLKQKIFYPENVVRVISFEKFISFLFQFLIGFGLCFQFPVVLLFLLKMNIIRTASLIKNFKYVVGIIFIISAILTPPDIVSQIALAAPMVVLYLLCILIGIIFIPHNKQGE